MEYLQNIITIFFFSKPRSRDLDDLDECSSDSDYDESSTPPTTKKKILYLASKKLKSCKSYSNRIPM
jgi:hypothetical protein